VLCSGPPKGRVQVLCSLVRWSKSNVHITEASQDSSNLLLVSHLLGQTQRDFKTIPRLLILPEGLIGVRQVGQCHALGVELLCLLGVADGLSPMHHRLREVTALESAPPLGQ
jgi:hypothetical protein